ncbi:Pfam:DUF227 [Geosmithia morbida]|uniref:Pfam:DUF227 n=1 Tax=Geosmithia morbida TaxID=1094350 RepID=A0A9P5D150_9HYPO|nr:Pfam:DUF227 [Geosmithia morbida]KAF4123483.1 Pfam:DUF227 [Geosmithia morbida]
MAGRVRRPVDEAASEPHLSPRGCSRDQDSGLSRGCFGFGQSNPAYQMTDSTGGGGGRFVMRRKPPGRPRSLDVDTGEAVGQLPRLDETTVRFFGDEARQPADRSRLVHGDYKVDDVVLHKTEARVTGILEHKTRKKNIQSWEISTVGRPLSDLCNLMTDLYTARYPGASTYDSSGFLPGRTHGLPQPDQILRRYREATGTGWYALRQPGSDRARCHAATRGASAEYAWGLVRRAAEESDVDKAKL